MKMKITIATIMFLFLFSLTSISFAQKNVKLAQTGFDFLSVISDAKAASMAGAVNAIEMGAGSIFFNPASMAGMPDSFEGIVSMNNWIADIKHYQFGAAVNLDNWGVFSVTLQNVNYGEFLLTKVDPDPNSNLGYIDIGTTTLQAYSIGIGYAKRITEQFFVGGQIKYAHQDLGEGIVPASLDITDTTTLKQSFTASPIVFDFGTLYKTGIKSLAFGMSVRNFSRQVKYAQEGFQLPLIFTIGISLNLMDFWPEAQNNHSLVIGVDATHDRSYPEQLLVGLNYTFMNMFSLRVGYNSNADLEKFSYGFGVSKFGFELDYSYTSFDFFDNVQRITLRFKL